MIDLGTKSNDPVNPIQPGAGAADPMASPLDTPPMAEEPAAGPAMTPPPVPGITETELSLRDVMEALKRIEDSLARIETKFGG